LCGAADGRVLDLTDAARANDFRQADEVVRGIEGADDRPGSFDTVVAVLWLSGATDPVEALARVAGSLAPGGEVLFLEPMRDPGIGRYGQEVVSPVLQRTAGWRVDRDIPALLRAEGWSITDLERIPMPRYLWPLHGLVEGRAHPRTATSA
jgi:SAM-dependent methyltransferase